MPSGTQYVSRSQALDAHEDVIWAVAWASNGQIVTGSCDELVHTFMIHDGKVERKQTLKGHSLGVNAVAVSESGAIAVSSALDAYIRVWDLEKGQELRSIDAGPLEAWGVALSPDGAVVAAGSQGGSIHLWSTSTGEKLGSLATGKFAMCVAIDGDSKYVGCGGEDGSIHVR